ncbi:hypothetical protein BGY98DRAFT_977540, partial [Russula aff. rugulosa BPL654]
MCRRLLCSAAKFSTLSTLLFALFSTDCQSSMSNTTTETFFAMSANEDRAPRLHITLTSPPPNPAPNGPSVPSVDEAKLRYYGIPSMPRFISRSSFDSWVVPTGMEAYLQPRELRPVGQHRLCDIWEGGLHVAVEDYLKQQSVVYMSVDPVRLWVVGEDAAPVIIWVGVEPGSLSHADGVDVAVGLRCILLANAIEDVHVEIRESVVTASAKMYEPVPSSDPTVQVREPFSTALGITICAEDTPHIQGTATLFFTVSSKPGKLFLLAARHVLFNVLLLGTNGFQARTQDIEKKIGGAQLILQQLERREAAAERERNAVNSEIAEQKEAITELEQFLADVKRDWTDPKNRIMVIVGEGRFTQDFAVIEVDTTKIDASNFIGNAIDLGTEYSVETLTAWMHPHIANQPSFEFPGDRILEFHGTLTIDQMHSPDPKNVDSRGEPTIMVLKRGATTGLTVGCLNNIRSILRKPFKALAGEYSMEVAVLPRTSKSGAFSDGGDSGAAVVNGKGAVAGMLTGGGGEVFDCSYVSPISFLLDCLKKYGYYANIFPVAA